MEGRVVENDQSSGRQVKCCKLAINSEIYGQPVEFDQNGGDMISHKNVLKISLAALFWIL